MPTYGYQCTQCDNQFEIVQRITDDPLKVCDKCAGILRKKIFPVGIAFKGTGFYVNDYAAKPASSSSPESTAVASEAKAATESKPGDAAAVKSEPVAPSTPVPTATTTPAVSTTPAPVATK